jgi:DNA (cytosine-5)-methyltransferase 1
MLISKTRLVSLFSGIGAFEKALTRQDIPYELVAFSEKDKWAVTSYCAIHGVHEGKKSWRYY